MAAQFWEWAQPPTPEWGTMLSDAAIYPKCMVGSDFSGLAILLTVLAFNLMGDGLRCTRSKIKAVTE